MLWITLENERYFGLMAIVDRVYIYLKEKNNNVIPVPTIAILIFK